MQSRDEYEKYIAPKRIEYIKSKIEIHKPKWVVFYTTSKDYNEYWEELIEEKSNHKVISGYKTQFFSKQDTCFIQVPHPNGVRAIQIKEFWKSLGEMIKENSCKSD